MTTKNDNAMIEDTDDEKSFALLFGRFRVMILNKLSSSRTSDLNKNNIILKSVFSKLYDAVNKKTVANRPGLNLIEFKISVHKLFPGFTLDEIKRLFVYFDADRSGRISVEEFIIGIKGRLNDYRQSLIDFVFHLLDADCNGLIEEKELTEYLKQTHMPGIVTGKNLPPEKKSRELIKKIGCEGASSNAISLKDLQEFYVDRGVFTADDVMFKYEVLDDWLFSEELCDLYLKNETQNFKPQKEAITSGLRRRNLEESVDLLPYLNRYELKRVDSSMSISSTPGSPRKLSNYTSDSENDDKNGRHLRNKKDRSEDEKSDLSSVSSSERGENITRRSKKRNSDPTPSSPTSPRDSPNKNNRNKDNKKNDTSNSNHNKNTEIQIKIDEQKRNLLKQQKLLQQFSNSNVNNNDNNFYSSGNSSYENTDTDRNDKGNVRSTSNSDNDNDSNNNKDNWYPPITIPRDKGPTSPRMNGNGSPRSASPKSFETIHEEDDDDDDIRMRKPGSPRGKSVPLIVLKERDPRLKSSSFTSNRILPDLPGSDVSEYQTKMDMQKAQLNEQKKTMEKMQERMNMQFQLQSQAALQEETETDERPDSPVNALSQLSYLNPHEPLQRKGKDPYTVEKYVSPRRRNLSFRNNGDRDKAIANAQLNLNKNLSNSSLNNMQLENTVFENTGLDPIEEKESNMDSITFEQANELHQTIDMLQNKLNQKDNLLKTKKNDKKELVLLYDKKILDFEKNIAILEQNNEESDKNFKEQQSIIATQQNLILTQQQMISNIQNMNSKR
mmetsp:Transcript_9390/g.9196  ORF Transcript_9390/g.9196 Transcript_9390/m.9196 type:complete len:782 (-) Transcript_9390:147-2492(-)